MTLTGMAGLAIAIAVYATVTGPKYLRASGERIALVIGNASYRNGIATLRNPATDAHAMARTLRGIGFELMGDSDGVAENLDRRALLDVIDKFARRAREAQIALLYYSGHGLSLGQENFLVPVDARMASSEAMLRADNVALSEVLAMLGEKERRLNVVILDACRDNPLPKLGKSMSLGRGLQRAEPAQGNLILYAAGAGQVALDRLTPSDTDPNGVFTRVLLHEIVKPGVEVRDAFDAVRTRVQQLANSVDHKQRPAIYDNKDGKFYFVSASAGTSHGTAPEVVRDSAADYPPGKVFRDCADCPEMVVIPAGEFMMGSPESEVGRMGFEGPQHRVEIVKAFAAGKHEVTFEQWDACVESGGCKHKPKDGGWGRGRQPVGIMSWDDAQEYLV